MGQRFNLNVKGLGGRGFCLFQNTVFAFNGVAELIILIRMFIYVHLATYVLLKSVTVLSDCEALAYLRFRHLGQLFMEPGDFYDVPIRKVLHFIRNVGPTKG
jgi:hypothetical protein